MDPARYRMIAEGGLRQEKKRMVWGDQECQKVLSEAFGDFFPSVRIEEDGRFWHEHIDGLGDDTVARSRPLGQNPWPKHEVQRFLAAWDKYQDLVSRVKDPKVLSVIGKLLVPDPVRERDLYRLYRDENGVMRVHVLAGFRRKGLKEPYTAKKLVERLRKQLEVAVDVVPGDVEKSGLQRGRDIRAHVVPQSVSVGVILAVAALGLFYALKTLPELQQRLRIDASIARVINHAKGGRGASSPVKAPADQPDESYLDFSVRMARHWGNSLAMLVKPPPKPRILEEGFRDGVVTHDALPMGMAPSWRPPELSPDVPALPLAYGAMSKEMEESLKPPPASSGLLKFFQRGRESPE